MIVTTIDPVTGTRVLDPEHHPFIIEGDGLTALKIYFESEDTRQAYLSTQQPEGYFSDMDPNIHE